MTPFLARILRFNQNTTYAFSGNTLTSQNVLDFQSYDSLFVKSNLVKNRESLYKKYSQEMMDTIASSYGQTRI